MHAVGQKMAIQNQNQYIWKQSTVTRNAQVAFHASTSLVKNKRQDNQQELKGGYNQSHRIQSHSHMHTHTSHHLRYDSVCCLASNTSRAAILKGTPSSMPSSFSRAAPRKASRRRPVSVRILGRDSSADRRVAWMCNMFRGGPMV